MRDFTDGTAEMSFVSEANGDFNSHTVQNTNDHFEHLTCFVGGMLVLGERLRGVRGSAGGWPGSTGCYARCLEVAPLHCSQHPGMHPACCQTCCPPPAPALFKR